MIPIPSYLARQGVKDMVRISDGRMSGTSFGTCVLHVAPDSSSRGPLAILRSGDMVTLDAFAGRLTVDIDDSEPARRLEAWEPAEVRHRRGWPRLYDEHVLQAPHGADFDFLVPRDQDSVRRVEPMIGRS
ncbi:dihydroxyacid dehydratase/phosphogluconate dehydratase [Glaciihabitans sp. UYNi722]